MANIFDRFDAPPETAGEGNLFDQFDAPQAQDPGLGSRFAIMARDAFEQSGVGTAKRYYQSGESNFDNMHDLDAAIREAEASGSPTGLGIMTDPRTGNKVRSPWQGARLDDLRRIRDEQQMIGHDKHQQWLPAELERRTEVEALPSFADDPTLTGKIAKGATNIGAMIVGGAPSPENLVPVGRGATLARTFLKGGAAAGATNAAVDYGAQQQDVRLGLQQEIDPERAALSTAIGAATGGLLNVAPHAVSNVRQAIRARNQPEPAPETPISGLLGIRDPDPMITFPDGSTARRSELDAMGLPPDASVRRRAELSGMVQDRTPTADEIVAARTVRPDTPIDDVIAQTTDGSGAARQAADIEAAFNEPVQIGDETVTMGDLYRLIADERSPMTVEQIIAEKMRSPNESLQQIVERRLGINERGGSPTARQAFGAEDSRVADAGKGQLERPVTVAEALNRDTQPGYRPTQDHMQAERGPQMPAFEQRARTEKVGADVQNSPLSTIREQAPKMDKNKPAVSGESAAGAQTVAGRAEGSMPVRQADEIATNGVIARGDDPSRRWQHTAKGKISELRDEPMWFSQEGDDFHLGDPNVAGTMKVDLDFKRPFVESKATQTDFQAIADAWKANGMDADVQASFMKDKDFEFGAHMVPGLKKALTDFGYDGVIADKSWKKPWAVALNAKKQVRVLDDGGVFERTTNATTKEHAPNQEVRSAGAEPAVDPQRGAGEAGGEGRPAAAEVAARGRGEGDGQEVAGREGKAEVDEGSGQGVRKEEGQGQRQEGQGQAKEEVAPDKDAPIYGPDFKMYDASAVAGEGVAKVGKWLFGGDYSEAKQDFTTLAKAIKGLFDKKGAPKPGDGDPRFFGKQLFTAMFSSAHGDIFSLYSALKKRGVDSPTMKKIIDMTHARAGAGEGVGRTFDEAFDSRVKAKMNDVDKIVKLMKESGATDEQVWRQVLNPKARQGKVGEAAKLVEQYFAESLDYMRKAGVEVGEQANYFTRILDENKVRDNRARFVDQATKLYIEDQKLAPDEARAAAEAYWYASVYGTEGRPGMPRVGNKGNMVKERTFGPAAEKHLGDFYRKDIVGTLMQYATTSARRAEIARRFGDNFDGWHTHEVEVDAPNGGKFKKKVKGIEEKLIEEGASEAIGPMRDYVELITGVKQYDVNKLHRTAASWSRTWFTLGSLTWSMVTSLPEVVMPIVRANADVKVAWNGYIKHLNAVIKAAGKDKNVLRQLNEDLGIVAGAHYGALSAQRFGSAADVTSSYQARAIEKFFSRNLLEPLTNMNRDMATSVAVAFMQKHADRVAKGNALSMRELRDLGVAKGDEKAFAEFVKGLDGRLPSADELRTAGKPGEQYMTALQRFSDQTVMRPNAAVRAKGASNPGVIGLIYHLQSFNYSFTKNVLGRVKNRAVGAMKDQDIKGFEAMQLGLAALPGMALIVAMQYALGEARDEATATLTGKKRDVKETTNAKIERAISRSGLLGIADPYVQMISGVRYQRPIASAAGGPVIGTAFDMAQTGVNMALNNSENTNNAERRFARNLYRYGIEPGVNLAMTSLPVNPATALTTLLFLPSMRESFVDDIAGEQGRRKPREIKGLSESIFSSDKGKKRNVGRSSSRRQTRDVGR